MFSKGNPLTTDSDDSKCPSTESTTCDNPSGVESCESAGKVTKPTLDRKNDPAEFDKVTEIPDDLEDTTPVISHVPHECNPWVHNVADPDDPTAPLIKTSCEN